MKKTLPMYKEAKQKQIKQADKNKSKHKKITEPIQEKDGELVMNYYLLGH